MTADTVLLLITATGEPERAIEVLSALDGCRTMRREPTPGDPGGGVPQGPPGVFTVACEWRGPACAGAADALASVRASLAPTVDVERSAALAGRNHELLPWAGGDGPGSAVLVYAMRRLPRLDQEAFHRYWLDVHSAFGLAALAGRGYRQVHADEKESALIAEAAGIGLSDFDGAVVSACTSWDAYVADRQVPAKRAAGAAALADEDNFIDHTRSMSMRYTVL